MTTAIIYETLEGQTGKIASFVEDVLRKMDEDVTRIDTADKMASVSFDGIKKVILAAPVHERRHPASFEVFVGASRRDLAARKTLMISVSLSAAFPEGIEEAGEYVTEFEMRTGFKSDVTILAAGAVRPSGYDYFQQQVIRHAVLGDRYQELGGGVQEFTDWDALADGVEAFMR